MRAIALLLGVIGGIGILYVHDPRQANPWYPGCIFYRLTSLYCPGCGSTRTMHLLSRLDLRGAWRYNPFVVLATPYLAYHFAAYQVRAWTGRQLPMPFLKPALIWTLFWLVIAFWILRNVPLFPFTLLAPAAGAG